MQYARVPRIDKPISLLVQGTVPLDPSDMGKSFALLDDVYAVGCNTFDTARVYGGGDRERLLGRWIKERDLREEVVVLTKHAHPNADRDRVTPFDIYLTPMSYGSGSSSRERFQTHPIHPPVAISTRAVLMPKECSRRSPPPGKKWNRGTSQLAISPENSTCTAQLGLTEAGRYRGIGRWPTAAGRCFCHHSMASHSIYETSCGLGPDRPVSSGRSDRQRAHPEKVGCADQPAYSLERGDVPLRRRRFWYGTGPGKDRQALPFLRKQPLLRKCRSTRAATHPVAGSSRALGQNDVGGISSRI